MRPIVMLPLSLCVAFACGDKKKTEEPADEAVECEDQGDCDEGEVCLAGECASTAGGAIYADPENAVTPDKIKSHADRVLEQAQQRTDEILEGAE